MWKTIFVGLVLCAANVAVAQQTQPPQPFPIDPQYAVPYYPTPITQPAQQPPTQIEKNDKNHPIVLLHISVIEVSTDKLSKLGLSMEKVIAGNSPGSASKVQKKSGSELFGSGSPLGGGGFEMIKADDQYFSSLNVLVKDRLAKIIAEPTLVTESGRAASFHQGGEIPLPNRQGTGNSAVEYKEYGNRFDFCPVVLDKETIRVELRGSISELDYKHGVTIDGQNVPGICSTTFDTALNVKNGDVVVLGGLVSRRPVEVAANVGELQKDQNSEVKQLSKEETEKVELLYLIKAEIVKPMQTAAKAPKGLLE